MRPLEWAFCLVFFLCAGSAQGASDRVGNGGDAIVCRNSGGLIQSAELLDFYERRVLLQQPIDLGDSSLTFDEKIEIMLQRLATISPYRANHYRTQVENFNSEASFLPGVTLKQIEDEEPTVFPVGCDIEQLAIQKAPIFPGEKRYIVSKDIWDHLDETSKAGLIIHEIIYREAIDYGHKTSVYVRYFNGLLASSDQAFNHLTTHQKIAEFMNMLNFLNTDFFGIPFVLDSAMFDERGNVKEAKAAHQGLHSLIIHGQNLVVTDPLVKSGILMAQVTEGHHYASHDGFTCGEGPLHLINLSLKECVLEPIEYGPQRILIEGTTAFNDGRVLSSRTKSKLFGRNYRIEFLPSTNYGIVTFYPNGMVRSAKILNDGGKPSEVGPGSGVFVDGHWHSVSLLEGPEGGAFSRKVIHFYDDGGYWYGLKLILSSQMVLQGAPHPEASSVYNSALHRNGRWIQAWRPRNIRIGAKTVHLDGGETGSAIFDEDHDVMFMHYPIEGHEYDLTLPVVQADGSVVEQRFEYDDNIPGPQSFSFCINKLGQVLNRDSSTEICRQSIEALFPR